MTNAPRQQGFSARQVATARAGLLVGVGTIARTAAANALYATIRAEVLAYHDGYTITSDTSSGNFDFVFSDTPITDPYTTTVQIGGASATKSFTVNSEKWLADASPPQWSYRTSTGSVGVNIGRFALAISTADITYKYKVTPAGLSKKVGYNYLPDNSREWQTIQVRAADKLSDPDPTTAISFEYRLTAQVKKARLYGSSVHIEHLALMDAQLDDIRAAKFTDTGGTLRSQITGTTISGKAIAGYLYSGNVCLGIHGYNTIGHTAPTQPAELYYDAFKLKDAYDIGGGTYSSAVFIASSSSSVTGPSASEALEYPVAPDVVNNAHPLVFGGQTYPESSFASYAVESSGYVYAAVNKTLTQPEIDAGVESITGFTKTRKDCVYQYAAIDGAIKKLKARQVGPDYPQAYTVQPLSYDHYPGTSARNGQFYLFAPPVGSPAATDPLNPALVVAGTKSEPLNFIEWLNTPITGYRYPAGGGKYLIICCDHSGFGPSDYVHARNLYVTEADGTVTGEITSVQTLTGTLDIKQNVYGLYLTGGHAY